MLDHVKEVNHADGLGLDDLRQTILVAVARVQENIGRAIACIAFLCIR